jgi:hypothetical protein
MNAHDADGQCSTAGSASLSGEVFMAKENEAATEAGACETMSEAEIDESLAETFPASDPPPWTLGVEPHCTPQDQEKKTQDED